MKKNKGFTLIEVIVTVAVLSLMLAGMFSIFDVGVKLYAKDNTQVANQESIRTVMTSIEKKIRKADHPNSPFLDNGGCLAIRSATTTDTFCLSGNTITLNGSPILNRVATFTFIISNTISSENKSSVTITISSIADSMNQVNTLSETFNARRGR